MEHSAPLALPITTKQPAPTPRSRPPRQELNHLLGFSLAPRVIPPALASPARRSTRRKHGLFSQQTFVNAQTRFVLKPTGDYTAHFADPDIFFDWPDVLQVIIPTSSALPSAAPSALAAHSYELVAEGDARPTCPICLSVPTAARMTKCGHVFCYPCMLHYLELADGTKWRKCPVCYDAIYAKDLKTVKWFDPISATASLVPTPTLSTSPPRMVQESPFAVLTEPLKMRLIRRPQITTLSLPRSSTWPSEAVLPLRAPWEFTPDAFTFAKFMLGSPDYIRAELESNLVELGAEIDLLKKWSGRKGPANDEELGIVFVRTAMRKVEEQIEKTNELKTSFVMTARKQALRELKEIESQQGRETLRLPVVETSSSELEEEAGTGGGGGPIEFLQSRSAHYSGAELSSNATPFTPSNASPPSLSSLSLAGKPRAPRRNINPPPPQDTTYFYYQAASGQAIFLDALDIKILKSHFGGSYDSFPSTIEVHIEGHEEGSMNEELRRRCRYLSHLPTGSDIIFIETDLGNIVSPRTLDSFASALKSRRTKRKERGRREDKAKAKSEQREIESRPTFMTNSGTTPSSYVFSHSNPYTSIPYAGFLESANFPSSFNSTPVVERAHEEPEQQEKKTVWGTTSFASALHAGSKGGAEEYEDDYDERWHQFEESNGRRGNNTSSGSAGGSNSGGGNAGGAGGGGGGGGGGKKSKKGKKLVLNLSGGANRGSG